MKDKHKIPILKVSNYLATIGREGGKSTSEAKQIAAKANALLGGRPGKVYIYGIVNLDNGRVEYVGQSRNVRARVNAHCCSTGKFRHRSTGGKFKVIQFPIAVVILAVTDTKHANEIEKAFYDHYKEHGECKMNGEKFCSFYANEPKWLKIRDLQA